MDYLIVLYIFASIMTIRFILYFSKFLYVKKVIKKQDLYVRSLFKEKSEKEIKKGNKAGSWVNDNLVQIKKVVENSSVSDYTNTYMEPVGYGHVQQKTMHALDNILYKNTDILMQARDVLQSTKGYYKVESFKCIKPIYWIEFIVFLPREIVNYFGDIDESKSSTFFIKIIQVIYWLISIIFMYLNYTKAL